MQFVYARQDVGYRMAMMFDPVYRYKREKLSDEHGRLFQTIVDKVGNWRLVDDFDDIHNQLSCLESEASYLQGLRDGVRLARLLRF